MHTVVGPSLPSSRPSRSGSDPIVGTVLDGDFEVIALAGSGSHADVFSAKQRSVGNRRVALKILARPYLSLKEADFRKAAAALVREGELLGALHAPCFVDVYRTGFLPDHRPYLAEEFAEGRALSDVCSAGPRLRDDQVGDLISQWADGLAEMHLRGWVHRDVTPANVVVSETVFGTMRIQVYDFGTATQISGRMDRHRVGFDLDRPVGTPAYMSPEQATGGLVDGRSDQYALAAIAYELLTGVRALSIDVQRAQPLLDYLRGNGTIPCKPLSSLRPDLPFAVQQVLHRGMERSADKRFETAIELARQLSAALAGVDLPKTSGTSWVSRLWRGAKR